MTRPDLSFALALRPLIERATPPLSPAQLRAARLRRLVAALSWAVGAALVGAALGNLLLWGLS